MKTGIKSKRNVTLVKAKLYDLIATRLGCLSVTTCHRSAAPNKTVLREIDRLLRLKQGI